MPGQRADYTFTLTGRTRLLFDSLTNNSNIVWRLRGPGGVSIIGDRSFTSSDSYDGSSVLDLAAGDYTCENQFCTDECLSIGSIMITPGGVADIFTWSGSRCLRRCRS